MLERHSHLDFLSFHVLGSGLEFGRVGRASKAASPPLPLPCQQQRQRCLALRGLSEAWDRGGVSGAGRGLGVGGGRIADGRKQRCSAVTYTSFLPPRPWRVSAVTMSFKPLRLEGLMLVCFGA